MNPAALTTGTPIYGMPILEAYKAKTIKTMMVFGDAKQVVEGMVKSVQ